MLFSSLLAYLNPRSRRPLRFGPRRGYPSHRPPGCRLTLEPLEARNLLDGGFANVLVNDPSADHPVTLVDINGITIVLTRDTQSETTLVLGDKGRVVVAYNDSGSENYSTSQREDIGYAVSPNGGQVFLDKGTPPDGPYGSYSDPVLARSAQTGTIFLATLASSKSRVLVGPDIADQINIFRSSDNGNNFQAPVNGSPGFVPGVDFQDKEWMAVDNNPGPGYGNVYLAWRDFSSDPANNGIFFTRSTDDGLTWGPKGGTPITPLGGQGAFVAIGPDHAVYVFWQQGQSIGGIKREAIGMRRSTDQGETFGDTVIVTGLKTQGANGDLGLTDASGPSFRSNAFPQAAVNPVTGDIYVVYDDQGNSKDRADVYFTQSSDGGQKWSNPVQVNDDKTGNDQWQPALAVTPDGSHVGVFWYDRRLDPADNLIDRFGVIGTVSGHTVTFAPNFRITDVSFPPAFGQDLGRAATYMGDYDQAVAESSYFYTTWGDNRLTNPNYALHVNQPDVRLAKIPVTTLAAAPTSAGAVSDNPNSQMLTQAAMQPIVILTDALARWGRVGVDMSALHEIDVRIANLGGAALGLASAPVILLDTNLAGYGWSVYAAPGEQGGLIGMDLSKVRTHEVGPLAQGHEAEGLMAEPRTAGAGMNPVSVAAPISGVLSKKTGGAPFGVEDFLGGWWGTDLADSGPSPAILAAIL